MLFPHLCWLLRCIFCFRRQMRYLFIQPSACSHPMFFKYRYFTECYCQSLFTAQLGLGVYLFLYLSVASPSTRGLRKNFGKNFRARLLQQLAFLSRQNLSVKTCVCICCPYSPVTRGWGCCSWLLRLQLLICSFRSVPLEPDCLISILW